jgi:nucleotide-binding universal stress UspA family protein
MKHILVPIGASENAKNTLQYAISMAATLEAKVFVFRAYKSISVTGTMMKIDEFMDRETKLYLRSIVNSVDRQEVDITIAAAKGGVIESIQAIHNEVGIDLIVVGPKSNSIRDEVFLGSTTGSIVKQTQIPVLVVPEGYQFKPFTTALTAFKSGVLDSPNMLTPLKVFMDKYGTKANLLLVKTPDYTEKDLEIDPELKAIENTFAVTENVTIFQGVLEHFQSNNPDLLCVFRRKRGFFQKLWAKNSVLKSEFHTTIPLLVLCGRQ